jgi:hypothetical protein
MPKFSFVLDVRDPPEKATGAMIDFSDRRPENWPNLSANIYQAHSVRAPRLFKSNEEQDVPRLHNVRPITAIMTSYLQNEGFLWDRLSGERSPGGDDHDG